MQCLGGSMQIFIRLILCLIIFSLPCSLVQANTLYVIAHKGSFEHTQNSQKFADYYLLKIKITALGQRIIPINLPVNHPMRQKFLILIFNRSPLALSEYWDRMSFRGVRPPLIQQSEQAVVLFVSRVKGAIGYVSHKPAKDSDVDILGEISL